MTIGTKLRGVLAIYVTVLAAVLVLHTTMMRQSVDGSRRLSAIASRHRLAAAQAGRLTEMTAGVQKYLVTRDRRYLDRVASDGAAFGVVLDSLGAQSLTTGERGAVERLRARWDTAVAWRQALRDAGVNAPATRAAADSVLSTLAAARSLNEQVMGSADAAMTRELRAADALAVRAERMLWIVGAGAIALGLLVAALLIRSITAPLGQLAAGTREIAAGRFGYRLRVRDGSGDELAAVSHDFNRMAARLDELDRLKRDFVSNVSHDLKTPLSSMQETTEALLDGLAGPLSDQQRQLLALNVESGRRLSSMLTKLLDLSRLESGVPRNPGVIDFGGLVRRAVDHVNGGRTGRGVPAVATLSLPDAPVLLRADAEDIAQLLDNLLENAVKFSPPDGVVSVVVAEDDAREDHVQLTVADEGPGIPAADKERVFDRFHQTAVGRGVRVGARGVGLGLSICRHIVTSHGGSISVRDNAPRGSVFVVSLPGVLAAELRTPSHDLAEAWI